MASHICLYAAAAAGWWHEACDMDEHSISLSGASYDGCCAWASEHEDSVGPGPLTVCHPDYDPSRESYNLADLVQCASNDGGCPSLAELE